MIDSDRNSDVEAQSRLRASRRLHATDAAAEFVVTVGGFAVLAAVLGICFYLAWVVVPLFSSGVAEEGVEFAGGGGGVPSAVYMGPYGEAAVFSRQGSGGGGVVVGLLENENLGGWGALQNEVVCESSARNGELIARGFRDGTVRLGSVEFSTKLFAAGSDTDGGIGYSEEIEGGRIRRVSVEESFGEPLKLKGGEGAVVLVDYQVDTTGKTVLAALREDLTVVVSSVRTIRPLGGGAAKTRLKATSFLLNGDEVPVGLKVSADGGQVFVVYRDGGMDRFAREKRDFVFRERVETLSTQRDDGGEVSVVEMVIGGQTVLIGDTFGGVQSWHVALDEQDRFGDGRFLVRSHSFGRVGEGDWGVGVVDLTPSGRDRTVGILYSDGVVVLRHLTSEKTIVRIESGVEGAVLVAIGPKNDAVLVAGGGDGGGGGGMGCMGMRRGMRSFRSRRCLGRLCMRGCLRRRMCISLRRGMILLR